MIRCGKQLDYFGMSAAAESKCIAVHLRFFPNKKYTKQKLWKNSLDVLNVYTFISHTQ